MAAKSDFAQKLLHDLRIRKERMAATQSSCRNPREISRDMKANPGRASREAQQFNAPEHYSSRKGNQRRNSNITSSSISSTESSNQIVLHEKVENSRQVMDLSAAIAFAFENSAKLTKASSSGSNPLVNFFKRFGQRSMESQKTIITGYNDQSLSVQKLDQVLKAACSNGIHFDKNLVEVGRELLKGSIDLEESLRMLVNLQEASQYTNMTRKKSRIKLIDEEDKDEEDQEDKASIIHVIKSKMLSHRRSTSCIPELSLSTEVKRDSSGESHSMPEKGRLSNVIVKLMGLDELPQLDHSTHKPQSSSLKGGKEKGLSKSQQLPQKNFTELEGGNSAMMLKKHHPIAQNQVNVQISRVTKKMENVRGDRELHIIETRERKKNVEHSQEAQSRKTLKGRAQGKHKGNLSTNYLEKRNEHKNLHQTNPQDQHVRRQVQIHKNLEYSESKQRANHKSQQLNKQHFLLNKQERRQRESSVSSTNKMKISRDKFARSAEKSMNFTETIPKKVPPNNRKQNIAPIVDTSKTIATSQERIIEGDKSQKLNPRDATFGKEEEDSGQLLTEVGSNSLVVNDKEVISATPDPSENQRKDFMMPTSGIKEDQGEVTPTKCYVSKVKSEILKQSDNSLTETENSINSCLEREYQRQNIPSMPALNENYHDSSKAGEVSDNLPTLDQSYVSTDDQELKQCDETNDCRDAKMLNKLENSLRSGQEEVNEPHNLPQQKLPKPGTGEQLTEPEKDLEEILIQSQTFLNTAQALFKLNVPISFLHATDQNNEVSYKTVILDCGNELMKRKVRLDVTLQSYVKTTEHFSRIMSLDDLVKKLCKDFKILETYGGNIENESDVAERLQTIVSNDIYNNYPDVNSMWDFEWNKMVFEKENVIRDVETYVLNGLLNEIIHDLLLIYV